VRLKRPGPPIHIGIDASSKLLPIVAFVEGEDAPRVKLYRLAEKSGPQACAAGIKAVQMFIASLPWEDISKRINLNVYIERPVAYGGGRGQAVFLQSFTSGAIQGAFAAHGARVNLVPPSSWKKAVVGHGGADKGRVASTVRRRWPYDYSLLGGSQDLIDAYCIARYARGVVTRRF
jgi:hypothetical protein